MNNSTKIAHLFVLALYVCPLMAADDTTGDSTPPAGNTPRPVTRSSSGSGLSGLVRSKSTDLKNKVVKKVALVPETGENIAQHLSPQEMQAWIGIDIQDSSPTKLVAMIQRVTQGDAEQGELDGGRKEALVKELFVQLKANRQKLVNRNGALMAVSLIAGGLAFWWSPGSTGFFQKTIVPLATGLFIWGGKGAGTAAKTWLDEKRLKQS